MDTTYWNLFWSTGMPEAWLMSRDREIPPFGAAPGCGQSLTAPLTDLPTPLSSDLPGSPRNLY